MNDKSVLMLAAAGLALGGVWWLTKAQGGTEQPRYQPDANKNVYEGFSDFPYGGEYLQGGQGDHFVPPSHHMGSTVLLPVRYPARSGHEISCIIHKGWDQLAKARPQDSDWMYSPVSEDDL
jgi:hypothetical protein